MHLVHFNPYAQASPARERGCYTCASFNGRMLASHVVCEREGRIRVVATATMGCAFWMREPGADDE